MANVQIILLRGYNNYFNRIIKKEESLTDYLRGRPYKLIQEVSFNENDGILTEHIFRDVEFTPDYCLEISSEGIILRRWFVTEWTRTRAGQHKASLRRDVLADFYTEVTNSYGFIKKGFVDDDNPLIFNKEDFDCNQIKVGESYIKDKSRCSWIVIFYNLKDKDNLVGYVTTIEEKYTSLNVVTIDDWSVYDSYKSGYKKFFSKSFRVYADPLGLLDVDNTYDSNVDYVKSFKQGLQGTGLIYSGSLNDCIGAINQCIESNKASIKTKLDSDEEETLSFNDFMEWDGKIVKTNDGIFHKLRIVRGADGHITNQYLTSGELYDSIVASFKVGGAFKDNWSGNFTKAISRSYGYNNYVLIAEPITTGVKTYTYDFRNTNELQDQPFGIIALPFEVDDEYGRYLSISGGNRIPYGLSLLIAKKLCESGVGPNSMIYDVQLLPYCPLDIESFAYVTDIALLTTGLTLGEDYTAIQDSNNNTVSISVHPTNSKFTKYIDSFSIMLKDSMNVEKTTKIENQVSFFRLCSPNYNGQFEFNKAKNKGLSFFRVDCAYKPYSPYIHISPDFNGLYGRDFGDARGLICNGDFSISVISDAWEQYKLQNKNFSETFDRNIQNMEVQHDINLTKNLINMGVSTTAGAILGANPGSPFQAIGAGAGLATGATNLIAGEKSYKEQHDMAIDMHNYQLGNIKALPNSLTKVDSYNPNNKIFPVIEKYSCTDEEIEIFKKKLEYEGMTVNASGIIKDYLNVGGITFIKADLYRIENVSEDSHLLYTIFEELSKGVYL